MDKKKDFLLSVVGLAILLVGAVIVSVMDYPLGYCLFFRLQFHTSLDCILLERISRIPVYLANKPLKTRAAKVLREVGKFKKLC